MNKSALLGKSGLFLNEASLSSESKHLIPLIR